MGVNDAIADQVIAHAVDLQRLGAAQQSEVTKQLLALQQELVARIQAGTGTAFTQSRLRALTSQIEATIRSGYDEVARQQSQALLQAVQIEQNFAMASLDAAIGGPLSTVALSDGQLRALVDGTMVQGRIVKDWWAKQGADTTAAVRGQLFAGFASGENTATITKRLVGGKGQPGILQATRAQAEALVLTSLSHVTNEAKLELYKGNADIIKAVQQLSTLDARTTEICIARSGKIWALDGTPIGHSIPFNGGPPLHFRCRSTLTAVTRSWDELAGPNAAMAKRRLSPAATKAAQASMDGTVAADLTYEQWLLQKEAASPGWVIAQGVLSKAKYALWSEGKIRLADLLDQRGNPLSLAALEAKVAKGGTEASLDVAKGVVGQFKDARKLHRAADKAARDSIAKSQIPDAERLAARDWVFLSRSLGEAGDAAPPVTSSAVVNERLAEVALRRKTVLGLQAEADEAQAVVDAASIRQSRATHARLHDPDGAVLFVPGGGTQLAGPNGVAWSVAKPQTWDAIPDAKFAEPPPMVAPPGKQLSTGALIIEDDGRVWLFQPKGQFGGYQRSIAKGRVEPDLTYQQNAIKEVFEETGLEIELIDHLADQERTSTLTRYYVARRKGGSPWLMGDEAEGVELLPLKQAIQTLGGDGNKLDQKLLWQMEAKLAAAGAGPKATDAVQAAAKVAGQEAQAAAQTSKTALFHAKANLMQGKALSAAQQAAVDALPAPAKADFMEVVAIGKAKAAAHAEVAKLLKAEPALKAELDAITGGKPFTIHSKGKADPEKVLARLQAQAPDVKAAAEIKAIKAKGLWAMQAAENIDDANPGLSPRAKLAMLEAEAAANFEWQKLIKASPVAKQAEEMWVPPLAGPQKAVTQQLKLKALQDAQRADAELHLYAFQEDATDLLGSLKAANPTAAPGDLKTILKMEVGADALLKAKAKTDLEADQLLALMQDGELFPTQKLLAIGDEMAALQKMQAIHTAGSPATKAAIFKLAQLAGDTAQPPWTPHTTHLKLWQAKVASQSKAAQADMMALVKDQPELFATKQAIQKAFPDLPAEEQLAKLQAEHAAWLQLDELAFNGGAAEGAAIKSAKQALGGYLGSPNVVDGNQTLLKAALKNLGVSDEADIAALNKLGALAKADPDTQALLAAHHANNTGMAPKAKLASIEAQLAAKSRAQKLIDDDGVPEDMWELALEDVSDADAHQKFTVALKNFQAMVDEADAAMAADFAEDLVTAPAAAKLAAAATRRFNALAQQNMIHKGMATAIEKNLPDATPGAKLRAMQAEIVAIKDLQEEMADGTIANFTINQALAKVPAAQAHQKYQIVLKQLVPDAPTPAAQVMTEAQATKQLTAWVQGATKEQYAVTKTIPDWVDLTAVQKIAALRQKGMLGGKASIDANKALVAQAEAEGVDDVLNALKFANPYHDPADLKPLLEAQIAAKAKFHSDHVAAGLTKEKLEVISAHGPLSASEAQETYWSDLVAKLDALDAPSSTVLGDVAEANAKLAAWAEGGPGLKPMQGFLAKAEKDLEWVALNPFQKVAKVEALQAAKLEANKLYSAKQKLAAGKPLSVAEAQTVNNLDGAAHLQFLDDVEAYKAKLGRVPSPEPAAKAAQAAHVAAEEVQEVNYADLVWSRPKPGGSVPGAVYRDQVTGIEWLIKEVSSDDASLNEILAGRLYAAAGAKVPELRITRSPDGRLWVASRWEDGLTKAPRDGSAPGIRDNFILDAWLGNWDVAGQSFDNVVLDSAGRAVRIDVGGSLRYRAQGGLKPNFGVTVDELESLRNPSINKQTAELFGKLTDAEIEAGVARLAAVTDAQINEIVLQFGPDTGKLELAATLRARRDFILARYPRAVPAKPVPPPPMAGGRELLQPTQHTQVVQAKAPGITRLSDKDLIEDHSVLVTVEADAQGIPARTVVAMKLREAAALPEPLKVAGGARQIDTSKIDTKMVALIRGVKSPQNTVVRDADLARLAEVRKEYDDLLIDIRVAEARGEMTTAEMNRIGSFYQSWIDDIANALEPGLNQPKNKAGTVLAGMFEPKPIVLKSKSGGLPWAKTEAMPTKKLNDAGYWVPDGQKHDHPMWEHFELELDGVTVRWFPYKGDNWTLGGRLLVEAKDVGPAATARIEKVLRQLEIDITPPSPDELRLRYAAQHYFARNMKMPAQGAKSTKAFADELEAALSKAAGYDITTSPYYNPSGVDGAMSGGIKRFQRADLDQVLTAAKVADTRLSHNGQNMEDMFKNMVEEGGFFSPKGEWLRQGRDPFAYGQSPQADQRSGGHNSVYTRLLQGFKTRQQPSGQFTWNGEAMRNASTITHKGDDYHTRLDQRSDRKSLHNVLPKSEAVTEVLFKNGLPLNEYEFVWFTESKAQRDRVLKYLRARPEFRRGLWYDGRKLEEAIR